MRRCWLALVWVGCNCDPAAQNGTALRMRVNLDPDVSVTQLELSASTSGMRLFEPVVRPEAPGPPLESGGSMLALLPDALDGHDVDCSVVGLSGGSAVASGTAAAKVKLGREVSCTVQLSLPTRCDDMSCAGCCSGNTCLAGGSQTACGSGGAPCAPCGPGQRCASGACLCDEASCGGCCSGTMCVDGGSETACGAGGSSCRACAFGQRCAAGGCLCDSASCAGCCNGASCLDGGADQTCGRGGNVCSACGAGQACTGGMCTCDGGSCTGGCNATTCTNGCCDGTTCVTPSAGKCGAAGVACFNCTTVTTDRCTVTDGGTASCTCGGSTACGANKRCVGGVCVCDPTVCGGCCSQSNVCEPGNTRQRCGADGGTCASCGSGMCVDGGCVP